MEEEFLKLFDKYSEQNIEEGIFYTLLKGDFKIYLSHFTKEYDMDDWENDESITVAFKDGLQILNYRGSLESVLNEIQKIINGNRV